METDYLFSVQCSLFDFGTYQNEFETLRFLFDKMPEKIQEFCRSSSLRWLQDLELNEKIEFELKSNKEKIEDSKILRQQGNQLFTAQGDKRNVLGACRLYNDAIYAALDTNSEELALSFANRAMSLQTFGYYQQAYDDCVCALKLGYPEGMRHKIILRQAYCAIKLNNIKMAEKHLSELLHFNLNKNFDKERNKLHGVLEELKQKSDNNKEDLNLEIEVPVNRDSQEIVTTQNKGRCMQAACFIEKNQLIFTERASAIVAVGDTRRICHQCGTVNFIPIPCLHCRGRVNYCSLKCQQKHASIHVNECPAYRLQLFPHVGIAHLALRIILDNGLYAILDELKTSNKTTTQIWCDLTEGGEIYTNKSIPYAESLRMMTNLEKNCKMDIKLYALVSHHLVVYLKHYTDYFEILNKNSRTINWELLTASLILRHIGQTISNSHTITTIIPRPLTIYNTTYYYNMLNDKMWSSPWHLKCGHLNLFSHYEDVATINLPYLSLCNHSCVQSFQPKISGRYFSAFALRDLNKGDEITNCYDYDYRKGKRTDRRERLKRNYHFDCQCENCQQTELEDIEFKKFHQYRCDNTKCRKIFVPHIPEKPTLNWWQSDHPNGNIDTNIYCTVCGCKQRIQWYHDFKRLMFTMLESDSRRRLYQIFKNTENTLLGLNDVRVFLAMKCVHEWFKLPYYDISLTNKDYSEIIDMLKYILEVIKAECSVNSIEYVSQMTTLWDLIAKRKYKCSKAAMDEMLFGLNIIADDLKVVFFNYYNDYIKDMF